MIVFVLLTTPSSIYMVLRIQVATKYQDFTYVFDKTKARMLPKHQTSYKA